LLKINLIFTVFDKISLARYKNRLGFKKTNLVTVEPKPTTVSINPWLEYISAITGYQKMASSCNVKRTRCTKTAIQLRTQPGFPSSLISNQRKPYLTREKKMAIDRRAGKYRKSATKNKIITMK
jgi:hypothetical protein